MIPNQTQLHAAYQKASPLVQNFITSPQLSTTFTAIREKHKLHLDEAGALSNALNAVFLEIVSFEQFPELLKEALEQNKDKHDVILSEVNEKVFTAFRESLKETKQAPEPAQVSVEAPAEVQSNSLEEKIRSVNLGGPTPAAKAQTNTFDKLEATVQEKPTDVEVSTQSPSPNKPYSNGTTDPYREPIE